MFISAYEETTRLCGFTDGENIIRLQQALKGQALKAVQLRLRKAENLEEVLDTLRSSYGRPELIVNTLLDQIKNAPVPRMEKLDTLVSYALMVEEISAAVRTGGFFKMLPRATEFSQLESPRIVNAKSSFNTLFKRKG